MAVYVDDMRMRARVGRLDARWSHLTADTHDELHAFAARLSLRRAWFQQHRLGPEWCHYDVTDTKRTQAISLGAVAERATDGARRRRAAATRRLEAGDDR